MKALNNGEHYGVSQKMITINILNIACLLSIFLNCCGQENNSSSNTETIKVGKSPGSVEVADFNNDKIPDLAVTSETDSSVTILLGKGNGKFIEAKGSPFFAGNAPNDIAIGDFNKDGNLDLAFANHDRKYLTVILGDGNGGFTPAPGSPFPVEVIPHTHGLATGDFNNDGRLDIVTDSWGNDRVEVLLGDSKKLFQTPGRFFKVGRHPYQRVRVADVNNDGNIDIVTTNLDGNNATVLLGDGKGNFNEDESSPFECGDSPFGLAIGDVSGDGKPDLAIIDSPASTADATGTNGLTILLGDGTGSFTKMKGSPFYAGNIPNRVAIGDINGDGINDIAVSDNGSNKIYIFIMNRKAVASQYSITVGNHPKGIAIADINGDGKSDIIVCNNSDDNISIILSK
jgi:FG-GAP-like repeat